MTELRISDIDIPDLTGKVAIITGGSSGIGYAAAKLIASRGGHAHILDLNPPDSPPQNTPGTLTYRKCNIGLWSELRSAFSSIGRVDMVFANAGVSEETNYFQDKFDAEGALEEPAYGVLGVNLRAVLNCVKLAWSSMRRHGVHGSIVLTISATAYSPEQSLPVYSAAKLALVGLVRSLRSTIVRDGITINGVAPAATITKLLPGNLAAPIIAAGLPVSDAEFVGRALIFSAVAKQARAVELYGKDKDEELQKEARWNGRVILTLGNRYTELEELTADLKPAWFGRENLRLTRAQQAATDFRE